MSEFIERQSLVATWLTQSESIEIEEDVIKRYIDYNTSLLKDFTFFVRDISLWDFFYVILFIGYNFEKDKFIIGCSASSSFEEALLGAYNEATLMEHYYQQDALYEKGEVKHSQYKGTTLKDAYAKQFYDKTVEEFYRDIEFFEKKCKEATQGLFI